MAANEAERRKALPGKAESYWIATTPGTDYPALGENITVDVAVIGGGIAGLTAAFLLKRGGARVAVIESRRILTGVTGRTTAKVTSNHELLYDYLIKHAGEEKARLYADAQQSALEFIARTVSEYNIACEFKRQTACTYAENDSGIKDIEAEADAAQKLGLPAGFTDRLPLPFDVRAAVCFTEQAHFHPRKYLLAIAKMIDGGGSRIFENTRAVEVNDGKPCEVITATNKVTANDVIVATNFPIINRGLLFTKMVPMRSYLTAAHLNDPLPEGMYISSSETFHTLRSHTSESGDTVWLIGGENHHAGQEPDTIGRYERVADFIKKNFDVKSIDYHWSTQDCKPIDRIPFIGQYSPAGSHVYVATGFKGWGMTNGTVSGILLSDLIFGHANPWTPLFDPNRVAPFLQEKFISAGIDFTRQFVGGKLEFGLKPMSELAPGEGGIHEKSDKDKEKVGAFRDEEGKIHAVSTTCQHLGCTVGWNNAEESWDCPCHGSRYDIDGHVINSPTVKDLPEKA